MKNLLKLSLLITGMAVSAVTFAQAPVTPAAPVAPAKQDTIKKDAKAAPVAPAAKKDAPAATPAPPVQGKDGNAPGSNKMAINEQGVPAKPGTAKPKSVTNPAPSTGTPVPDKKKED